MGTEATYNNKLISNVTLSGVVSDRIYPIKLPQNITYPCLIYRVDEAVVEGTLDIEANPTCLYVFENMYYANSYSQIIAITDALRDICTENDWNIDSFVDMDFDSDVSVFSRVLRISINSNL
mgnify:CR=1 FL=1